jgi:hypothetical protein
MRSKKYEKEKAQRIANGEKVGDDDVENPSNWVLYTTSENKPPFFNDVNKDLYVDPKGVICKRAYVLVDKQLGQSLIAPVTFITPSTPLYSQGRYIWREIPQEGKTFLKHDS